MSKVPFTKSPAEEDETRGQVMRTPEDVEAMCGPVMHASFNTGRPYPNRCRSWRGALSTGASFRRKPHCRVRNVIGIAKSYLAQILDCGGEAKLIVRTTGSA